MKVLFSTFNSLGELLLTVMWMARLRNSGDWPYLYLRYITSQPEKKKKVPFHHQHLSFPSHWGALSSGKKCSHVEALPDQTEGLRWCQNLPGLKSPITDDGLKPTKWWKSTYGTITFIYLYKNYDCVLMYKLQWKHLLKHIRLLQFKELIK